MVFKSLSDNYDIVLIIYKPSFPNQASEGQNINLSNIGRALQSPNGKTFKLEEATWGRESCLFLLDENSFASIRSSDTMCELQSVCRVYRRRVVVDNNLSLSRHSTSGGQRNPPSFFVTSTTGEDQAFLPLYCGTYRWVPCSSSSSSV